MPQDRRRHVLQEVLAVLAAGLLLALALEGGARLLGVGAPERPDALPKRSGVFRILTLGGSTVQGVPDGDLGFVTQLAAGLSDLAGDRPVEILNWARSGAPSSEVLALLEASADVEPDLVIVLTGHNEFLAARAAGGLRGLLQRLRDDSQLVRALVGTSDPTPERYADLVLTVDATQRAEVSEAFYSNLAEIVAIAASRGVPLFLCTAPANLADWPPAHRQLAPAPPQQPDPLAALAHYREGEVLRRQGRSGEAREQFGLALDLDPVPRRAFRAFNDALRAQADRDGVYVIDVVERFDAQARQGLVGFELVCDNCHPTPLGNALIAHEIAATMARAGLLLRPDTPIEPAEAWLARARRRIGGPEPQARAHLRWLLSNAIYAMKTPFFNFEAARDYLEQARALAPGDWRVYANLGTLSLLEGDPQTGRRALARATALKGEPLDPEDRHLTPYLKEALAGGLPGAAGGQPAASAGGS